MRTTLLCLVLTFSISYQPAPSNSSSANRMVVIKKPRSAGSFFDLGQGAIRVLAVVPNADSTSDETISRIVDVFAAIPSNRVRAFIVYSPTGPDDSELLTLQRFGKIHDHRFVGFWDPTSAISNHWRVPAGLSPDEGSAVFLYETGTRFIDVDTIPPFWRHRPGENVLPLHTLALRDSVVAMLGRFAQRSEADEEARSEP
jgi:hypothetical protein